MPSVDSNYDRKVNSSTPAYQYNPLPQSSQAAPAAPSTSYNPLSGMTGRQESSAPVTPLSGVGQYQTVDPGFTAVNYKNLEIPNLKLGLINNDHINIKERNFA
jgi:hypothetical protein